MGGYRFEQGFAAAVRMATGPAAIQAITSLNKTLKTYEVFGSQSYLKPLLTDWGQDAIVQQFTPQFPDPTKELLDSTRLVERSTERLWALSSVQSQLAEITSAAAPAALEFGGFNGHAAAFDRTQHLASAMQADIASATTAWSSAATSVTALLKNAGFSLDTVAASTSTLASFTTVVPKMTVDFARFLPDPPQPLFDQSVLDLLTTPASAVTTSVRQILDSTEGLTATLQGFATQALPNISDVIFHPDVVGAWQANFTDIIDCFEKMLSHEEAGAFAEIREALAKSRGQRFEAWVESIQPCSLHIRRTLVGTVTLIHLMWLYHCLMIVNPQLANMIMVALTLGPLASYVGMKANSS